MNRWLFGVTILDSNSYSMHNCPICKCQNFRQLFTQKNIPVLQNKTYTSLEESLKAEVSDVNLVQCEKCKFVFNSSFNPNLLRYDNNYQNEQANSEFFLEHLTYVYQILKEHGIQNKKVVEIGCGKGFFLQLLKKDGVRITGFDPVYEGTDPAIIKDYFSSKYLIQADLIILRHTLEHIFEPLDFLQNISSSNNNDGLIYIEVPTFEWIFRNNAFEDIFYEHCNYFTPDTLKMLFDRSETGQLFNGQYIYLIARLKDLKQQIEYNKSFVFNDVFSSKVREYSHAIEHRKNIAIWGAGAKGSTYLNLIDPNREHITVVIDINQQKQNRFIGHTGHKIISPEALKDYNIKDIIIMNPNYFNEIKRANIHLGKRISTLNNFQ